MAYSQLGGDDMKHIQLVRRDAWINLTGSFVPQWVDVDLNPFSVTPECESSFLYLYFCWFFLRHLWQIILFPEHTEHCQFSRAATRKVRPAEHAVEDISRCWLKYSLSSAFRYKIFAVNSIWAVVVIMLSGTVVCRQF